MPSWNEKPHFTPAVNVNLKPCSSPVLCAEMPASDTGHLLTCAAAPILLPCPLPRSVTLEVRWGECTRDPFICDLPQHGTTCPARPIRVSCSISGKTWAESEPFDMHQPDGGYLVDAKTQTLIRERWALVKALVLGYSAWDYAMSHAKAVPLATITAMLAQRDTVFSALADMARAEEAAFAAQERAEKAYPYHRLGRVGDGSHAGPRPSRARLAAYVEFLVEQVGVLS